MAYFAHGKVSLTHLPCNELYNPLWSQKNVGGPGHRARVGWGFRWVGGETVFTDGGKDTKNSLSIFNLQSSVYEHTHIMPCMIHKEIGAREGERLSRLQGKGGGWEIWSVLHLMAKLGLRELLWFADCCGGSSHMCRCSPHHSRDICSPCWWGLIWDWWGLVWD